MTNLFLAPEIAQLKYLL